VVFGVLTTDSLEQVGRGGGVGVCVGGWGGGACVRACVHAHGCGCASWLQC